MEADAHAAAEIIAARMRIGIVEIGRAVRRLVEARLGRERHILGPTRRGMARARRGHGEPGGVLAAKADRVSLVLRARTIGRFRRLLSDGLRDQGPVALAARRRLAGFLLGRRRLRGVLGHACCGRREERRRKGGEQKLGFEGRGR